jgi:hypothetical protein
LDGTYSHGGRTYSLTSGCLILKVPSVDSLENAIDITSVFDRIVYAPDLDDSAVLLRLVFPDASSHRSLESQPYGSSLDSSSYQGAFASEPNALGAFVIHYQFMIRREMMGKIYEAPVSGSTRLRNKL